MKPTAIFLVGLFLVLPPSSQCEDAEAAVRIPIQAFNKAFNEGFVGPADYATEDWNHINPFGGRDRGREATLKTVRAVHQTFLKGATETIEDIDVRFASEDVAVATVTSSLSGMMRSSRSLRRNPRCPSGIQRRSGTTAS
jgi:ketosteroid isomerase-like protein